MNGEGSDVHGGAEAAGEARSEGAGNPLVGLGAVVEAVVYAPLGLALEGRTLLPRLVERGRNQVAMARMVGEFAVRKGAEDLAAGAVSAQRRVVGMLGGDQPPRPSSPAREDSRAGRTADTTPVSAKVAPEAAAAAAGIDPEDLPIPGYDLLSASQVVPRLESLSPEELELVARYEAGTRGRRTILAKVDQLRIGGPG